MSRQYDFDNGVERIRQYADDTSSTLVERGRQLGRRKQAYAQQVSRAAEDLADNANYQYRRLRRHVKRHPVATTAIVTGVAVGAFLLARYLLRDRDGD